MSFKKKLRPEDDPLSWELKGSRGFYETEEELDIKELKRMWQLFSDFVSTLNVPFHTFCVIADKHKIKQSDEYSDINWDKKKFAHSFMRVNFYTLLFMFIILQQRSNQMIIEDDKIVFTDVQFPFKVYYDDLNDRKIARQFKVIFDSCLDELKVSTCNEFSFIKFEAGKKECLIIQFVDMLVYVLHRFLVGKSVVGLTDSYDSLFRYYSKILHAVRHSFIKNVYFGKSPTAYSSCVLLSDHKDYNFAVKLENECNYSSR